MKFNTKIVAERKAALSTFMRLVNKREVVDIKKVNPKRSLNQNSYLHLLIGAFGAHFGYTMEEAKTLYKRDANPSTYVYEKNDMKFLRSSADLDKEEMAKTIDRFMEYSKEAGYELPPATNPEWLMQVQNEIERSAHHL
jgi:hypothetical protein